MEPHEDLLRRLAFNDEKALSTVLTRRRYGEADADLSPKVELLVQLAALLAARDSGPLLVDTVARARTEGATEVEIVGVLVAVGPALGLASLVASASHLAAAIGYDLENGYP
jgi:alkylhydroperoxidase/carboxymuconolactone decarboxylase family protein YurZ